MAALDLWLLLLCIFGLLVALGATSGVVNEQLWVSEPLACVLAGVAVGPLGAGLLHLDPATNKLDAAIVREAARVTLAIAVTGAAMRLPAYWLTQNWRGLAIALGPGMLLMWAAGALVTSVTIGLPTLGCLLLGAAIAPTDPVLSAPILSGRAGAARRAARPAQRHDGRERHQ
jgi:NhaP-type Na+/H+ or K+/H+ antiporter